MGCVAPGCLSVAMVAKLVPTKQVKNIPEARAAVDKEFDNLVKRDCWRIEEARPWREVKAEANAQVDPRTGKPKVIHLGSLLELCYLKGSELSELERKYKGRVVFLGDRVKEQHGA